MTNFLIRRPKPSRKKAEHRLRTRHGGVRLSQRVHAPRLRRLRRLRGVPGGSDGCVERGRGREVEEGGGETREEDLGELGKADSGTSHRAEGQEEVRQKQVSETEVVDQELSINREQFY